LALASAGLVAGATALVGDSPPEPASASEITHQAESMDFGVMSADGTAWPKSDTYSGAQSLHFGPNGTAAKTLTVSDFSAITLRASGTQCAGAPQAKVMIDGNSVGSVSVTSTTWTSYRIAVARPAGSYRVAVSFDNNYYSSGCNRDLYLDQFTLTTTDTAPAPAPAPDAAPAPAPAGAGNVVWAADGERTLASEWATGNAFDVNDSKGTSTLSPQWAADTRVRRVTSPVAQGSWAYSITVRGSDRDAYTRSAQRTELGQSNSPRTMSDGVDRQMYAGQERWIALQLCIPADYPSPRWNTLVQLKGEGRGNGPLGIYWENRRLVLKKSDSQIYGSTDVSTVWAAPAATLRERWVKLMVHVNWSTGGDGGYELLGDLADGLGFRRLKAFTPGWTLKYGSDGGAASVGARIGIYREAVGQDTTAYFDGFNVAATRVDASLRAFGEAL
jgi:Polysaccharide lyase/Ca-dependent carbohydrate-binding module xylan-binding